MSKNNAATESPADAVARAWKPVRAEMDNIKAIRQRAVTAYCIDAENMDALQAALDALLARTDAE